MDTYLLFLSLIIMSTKHALLFFSLKYRIHKVISDVYLIQNTKLYNIIFILIFVLRKYQLEPLIMNSIITSFQMLGHGLSPKEKKSNSK